MDKKYTKSFSNYVIKSNPSASKDGYIYENDVLTTSKGYNSVIGATTTNGGFTFIINTEPDKAKTYNNDGWDNNRYTLSNLKISESDIKKSGELGLNTIINEQKFVKLNKTQLDLAEFCYFGSANAMLKASVDHIITNFPAGVYLTSAVGTIVNGNNITMSIVDDSVNGYLQNKFILDLFNYYADERVNLNYNLKTMASSYFDYEAVNENGELIGNVISFTGYTTTTQDKVTFGLDGIMTTWSTLSIRPNKTKRDEFFNSLDDFQSLLLNQYSVPKYRCNIKIPVSSGDGVKSEYKSFIWSTSDGYNIDIDSSDYNLFISELIDATNLIDEMYADNVYRMLTHDSIKTLDATFYQEIDEDIIDEIIIGGTKIQKLLRLYGRSFDELNKYISAISNVNNITYDKINNIPSEYLNNRCQLSGWDNFSLSTNDNNNDAVDNLFYNSTKPYSVSDINNHIYRNLIINSPYIFKSKGTKKSIRKILGLLGVDNDWYVINEFIQKIDSFISGDTLENIAELNYGIHPNDVGVGDGKSEYKYTGEQYLFDNTNIGTFIKCPICDSEDYYISGETIAICTKHGYAFDLTGNTIGYPKPMQNTNQYYFQQKGNWYRETGGIHTNLTGLTYVNEISYGNNPHVGNGNYDNGYDYIDQFTNIFKRYVRSANDSAYQLLGEYMNKGFSISNKKEVDNKIKWASKNEDRLILNLKNIVIGFNGDKMLQSFFKNNTLTNNVIDYSDSEINEFSKEYTQIINNDGVTNAYYDYLKDGMKVKIHNSLLGNGLDVILNVHGDIYNIKSGKTMIIDNTNGLNVREYNGEDEFIALKNISLPYLEQLIPATSIFDFVLIDNKTPKWLLIDKYCERDENGGYTGYKILAYQNINYFDDTTSEPTQALINAIESDFGLGYEYFKTTSNDGYTLSENGNILTFENNVNTKLESSFGFDTIYLFKGKSDDCNVNADAIWEVEENILET